MNPREVILRVLADYELHPGDVDRLLDALCPPGGRVVVSRESKPCEPCGGAGQWYHQDTYDAVSCESCGGSGVVEATTIHGLEEVELHWNGIEQALDVYGDGRPEQYDASMPLVKLVELAAADLPVPGEPGA